MKMRSWSDSSGDILVPSTFTGWYRNTMMTIASVKATAKSRIQPFNSRGNEELACTAGTTSAGLTSIGLTSGDLASVSSDCDDIASGLGFVSSVIGKLLSL